jgi:L-iditol 2-dehydrogenase
VRAAILYGPSELAIEELPSPKPGPGEVVLDIVAACTCGTDVKSYKRGHPSLGGYPARLGHEFAGVVAAVGEGVERVAVGDEVFCANSAPCGVCFQCTRGRFSLCEDLLYLLGGFAEQLLVPPRIVAVNLHRLPPGLDLATAPIAEPLACALHAVDRAGIGIGDRIAIVGAGALGIMLCALVSRAGGEPIVCNPVPGRLELAKRFGAAETVVGLNGGADVQKVLSLTAGGRGADQVFEAVGRPGTWELAIELARPGGAVNLFGGCAHGTRVGLRTERVHYEEIELRATYHHAPRYIEGALRVLAEGDEPWSELCGPAIGLDDLQAALEGTLEATPAPKYSVRPAGVR